MYSTLELEAAILSAHEEISRKDDEIIQIKDLLAKIMKERDEFQAKCQNLSMEKQLLLQRLQVQACPPGQVDQPISSNTTISNQDESIDLSPSHCDDNNAIMGSPGCKDTLPLHPSLDEPLILDITNKLSPKKPFPEKGKFLQAVMEAGPLLQTLLLAGPLPQWQHPPPQLNSIDIPPVTITSPRVQMLHHESPILSPSGGFTNKRALVINNGEGLFDPPPHSKHQKICSPIIIDPNL